MASIPVSARLGRGFFVDAVLAVMARVGTLVLTAIGARMLTPSAFGAVAIALSIAGVVEMVTQITLGSYLQQRPGLSVEMVDVAWTMVLLRSLAVSVLILFTAPWLATLWDGGEAVTLYLRLLAVGFVGDALVNAHMVWRQRDLQFGLAFFLQNLKPLLGVIASITILLVTKDPVAFVAGSTLGSFLAAIVSWFMVKPRPRFAWNRGMVKELLGFAPWLSAHSIFIYLVFTLDNMYVARALGMAALGVYSLGWRLVNVAMTLLTRAFPRMLISTYASVWDDPERLRSFVTRGLSLAHFVAAGVGLLLMVFAEDLIVLIGGGGDWQAAAVVMMGLTPFAAARMQDQVVYPLFVTANKPRVLAFVAGAQVALLLPTLWLGVALGGLAGVAIAMSILNVLGSFLLGWLVKVNFGITGAEQLRSLPRALLAAGLAALVVFPLFRGLAAGALHFFLGAPVMGLAYVAAWELSLRWLPPGDGQALSIVGIVKPLLSRFQRPTHSSTP